MKKLEEKVEITGTGIPNLTATLIERTRQKAIYLRSDDIYEVFKIKIHPPAELYGRSYPEREAYPSNEDFGKTAWTYTSLEKARKKYKKI
jgi:hypothetical protein